ncbi:MAG: EAL domain-containing response regulator [Burkholderiales bacterium]|nr:EAL domain-containing response regulator [Nitrosomonas sp.]MCP5274943.1 EAL domain-containing response regulator [Burkholderiales bacterium]
MSLSKTMRVMLLDDDRFMLDFVSELLKELGVDEVLRVQDGKTGLEVLSEQVKEIDLLICDIEMPKMDGIEFLRHIANRKYCGNIVLFSGIDADLLKAAERFAKVSGLQVLGTLPKPVTLGALAAVMEKLAQGVTVTHHNGTQSSKLRIDVNDIRNALLNDEFSVFYQPKVVVSDFRTNGFESLARWRHAQIGFIPPDEFIPVIEQTEGLMDEFTLIILRKSVHQLALWLDQGLDLKASVNISMENLNRHDLPEIFEEVVRTARVPRNRVVLEITEGKLGKDFALCLDILTRLRIKGFGLSIDDFGTGYATMETLNNLPFTELKIDRVFVNAAVSDPSSRAIVESSINLGKEFGLNIVAEGVENQTEWDLVAGLGCTEVQGYFISKPLPHEEFSQLNGLSA